MKLRQSELDALSREDLLELARKLQKVEASQKARTLESYLETCHPGQIAFHRADYRVRYVFCGNRWGKTTAGTVELIWRCLGRHPFIKGPVPIKSAIVAQDFETHVRTVLEEKIKQWAPAGSILKTETTQTGALKKIFWSTGSTTDILSHDQDIKVFEGSDYDYVWFDEPPPQKIFNALWRGLTDRGGACAITGTPIVQPWLYAQFQKAMSGTDDLRWGTEGDTDDNAVNLGGGDRELGMKRIEQMIEMYEPEEREARRHGKFLSMQGLIFKSFSRDHHLIEPFPWPSKWPIWESIDPHSRKPWAVSWIGLTPRGHKILIRSAYLDGTIEQVGQQIVAVRTELELDVTGRKARIQRTLIDNAAGAPTWNRNSHDPLMMQKVTIKEELEGYIGPRAGGPRIEMPVKNVKQKIEILKSWMHIKPDKDGKPDSQFYAFDGECNELFVKEIEHYVWDSKRGGTRTGLKDTPKKENDDILDTIMQVCLALPRELEEEPEILRTVNG